jgi:hypothetical protein
LLTPSPAETFRELDACLGASGQYDFAVRGQRRSSCGTACSHRIPRSTFVTTRNAPPDERGTTVLYCCFYQTKKRNIFCGEAGRDGQISAVAP